MQNGSLDLACVQSNDDCLMLFIILFPSNFKVVIS